MVSQPGWKQVFRPWLESKIQNSWIDPKGATSKDEFFYQYTVAHGFAQAAQQILDFVKENLNTAQTLTDKQEDKNIEKDFGVGK